MKRELYRLNTDIFVKRSNEVHGGKYDYSKAVYKNKRTKVCIICPIHGEFWQKAGNHLRGQGCPECGKKYASEWRKGKWKDFVNESYKRFGDTYEFPSIESEYENSHSKITIKCKKCGNVFTKIACDHLTSTHGGCLKCFANTSYGERELNDFIISLLGEENVKVRDRSILDNGYELDIYIPSKSIAIEYDGVFWHSDASNKDKFYHLKKTEECLTKGIGLIHVFEDEWVYHKTIVKEKLRHILGCSYNLDKIMARKCVIKDIEKSMAKEFLEKFHIQGFSPSTAYCGCFYDEKLIGVMSFKKEKKDGQWELTRFTTDYRYICQGVGGKIFKWFVKKYSPTEVKSFADRRWTLKKDENMYTKMGFRLEKTLLPDYKYIMPKECIRYHKFRFRKNILHKKYGFPLTMTESEMAKEIKAYRIYDCGLFKYVWKLNN